MDGGRWTMDGGRRSTVHRLWSIVYRLWSIVHLRIHPLNQNRHTDAVDNPAEEKDEQHDQIDQGEVGQELGGEAGQPVAAGEDERGQRVQAEEGGGQAALWQGEDDRGDIHPKLRHQPHSLVHVGIERPHRRQQQPQGRARQHQGEDAQGKEEDAPIGGDAQDEDGRDE